MMKKILLLLLTAITITFFTPNRALVDLKVHMGEVWTDETLVAPFDIPILKGNATIDRERADIVANFKPIFRIDTLASSRQNAALIAVMRHDRDNERFVEPVAEFLTRVSSIGIIPSAEAIKYSEKFVRISDLQNNLRTIPVAELYTPEQIIAELRKMNVQTTNLLEFIQPNLVYSDKLNNQIRQTELNSISSTRSMIHTGETIITKGQIVDEPTFLILRSFRLEYETKIGQNVGIYEVLFGRFLLILVLLGVNFQFFSSFVKNFFAASFKPWIFVMSLYVLMAGLMAVAVNIPVVSPFVVPLPIVAIYLMNYFNMRVAFLGNITVAILCALFVRIPFDFFLVNFVSGMTAIFIMQHHYHRHKLFKAIGVIFVTQIVVFIGVSLLREADLFALKYTTIVWFLLNVFLILGFYQAVYLIERLFGFVSDVTLLELCDTNQPLLLELAEKAPATFQHSVQVANLAEAAAKEIGANPLLARTGAMYHDIGKMEDPFYFTENQSGGFNPHSELTPIESAQIIRKHVSDGVAIATKNRLPKQISDFIEGHHGKSLMYFFYAQQLKLTPDLVDDSAFRYAGPFPVAKEVTICMMADAVEAASRSLKSYDKKSLDEFVDKIVEIQIGEYQLSKSEVSFREVDQIKTVFKNKLNTIYHVRVSYPDRVQ